MTSTTKRLAELLWSYEADEPHLHWDNGPGHYPAITWREMERYTQQPHEGDCIGLPATCVRCVAEEIVFKAQWIAERLNRPAPPAVRDHESLLKSEK